MSNRQRVERVLMAVGLILLAVYAVVRIDGLVASRSATQAFDQLAINGSLHSRDSQVAAAIPDLNTSAWAPERAAAFAASLVKVHATPMGVLRLDKLNLRIPVFEGTSGRVLNRGAGWIRGTARPGEQGNIGIAGHRDGFFRGLKDYSVGDSMELATTEGADEYVVDQIEIVDPEDVDVLQPRQKPSITLVTCYPFHFVGDAPQRFIVHAALKESLRYQ